MTRGCVGKAFGAYLLVAACAATGEPAGYSVDEYIAIGLESSSASRNARRDQAIAERVMQQARSIVLPSFSAGASYTRLDEVEEFEFGDDTLELGSEDNYSADVSVSQLLYAGGRGTAALKAGRLTREQARWSRVATESDLVLQIETHFSDILLAGETIKVMRESVAHLEDLLKQTQDKQRSGTASAFDAITARVRVANERPKLLAAENERDIALAQFARLVGLDAVHGVQGELRFAPWEGGELVDLKQRAVAQRASLHRLRSIVGLREQDIQAARSAGRPEVNAIFQYAGANSYEFASYDDKWEWHWNATVGLTWDLWDGGLTRAGVGEKELVLEKAREMLFDAIRGVELDVTQAFLDLQYARKRVEADEDNVELASKALRIASERYEAGLGTYLEFTDANVALSQAKLNYLGAVHQHMNAVASLRHASGILHPAVAERMEP